MRHVWGLWRPGCPPGCGAAWQASTIAHHVCPCQCPWPMLPQEPVVHRPCTASKLTHSSAPYSAPQHRGGRNLRESVASPLFARRRCTVPSPHIHTRTPPSWQFHDLRNHIRRAQKGPTTCTGEVSSQNGSMPCFVLLQSHVHGLLAQDRHAPPLVRSTRRIFLVPAGCNFLAHPGRMLEDRSPSLHLPGTNRSPASLMSDTEAAEYVFHSLPTPSLPSV